MRIIAERGIAEMKTNREIVFTILALLLISGSAISGPTDIPGKKQDHPIALIGGTIHTISGRTIENGSILFDKGKIVSVGTNIDLPPGTETVKIDGKHVYPGMIDARSNIGLVEIDAVRATRDVTEAGSINPNIRAEVAVNPESEVIPVTRANGITSAVTLPDGGTMSGTAAVIDLDGWTWEEMTRKAPAGLVVNWPSMTITKAWWERRSEEEQKKARENALRELQETFKNARAYEKAKLAESNKAVPNHKTDIRYESMIPVLEGKIPVLMNAEEVQQIEAAVAWADQEHVKLVFLGGYDAWRVAGLLKEHNVAVIVNPIHRTPWRRWEPYDQQFVIPKLLYDAGVKFCIAGDGGASNERNLPYHAATAAAYGLPEEEALKAVTLYPAQILGIDGEVGSLESGKDASLIVTTGDPLETSTQVEMEFIRGKSVSLESKHTHLFEKYKEKYRRLGSSQ